MILKAIVVGELGVNCYVLASSDGSSAILIDPGADHPKINKFLEEHRLSPAFIINTHGHFDHIGLDNYFKIPVYIFRQEEKLLKDKIANLSSFLGSPYSVKADLKLLDDNEEIILSDICLKVIHTPGHTPGGISLLMQRPKNNILFSGDSLFYRGIGRTDFSGASHELLVASIKDRLLTLPKETIVYPGHGPSTTIGEELENNPFLN